ncbi:MAG TPA: 2'-deoxycytidine 5'-triphosphate deaminase [Rhizomicrobium sp.]|nr:2'-deoxycytidine 5'-triphosphate deaminase [Rhizomicrobium sp.]
MLVFKTDEFPGRRTGRALARSPLILEHGQIVGRLVFERLTNPPPEAYGAGLGSNYQGQDLKLSKHFRTP